MILGTNFSSGSGPEIPLNVSLLIRFGGHVTTKQGTTWLVANEKGSHLRSCFSGWKGRQRAVGSSSIPESGRLGRDAPTWLMPGARSKRCRQARPLTSGARLAERERPGTVTLINAEPRSLSARSAQPRLSRAASPAPLARRNVGAVMEPTQRRWGKGSAFLTFHACDWCGTPEQLHGRLLPAARCGRGWRQCR